MDYLKIRSLQTFPPMQETNLLYRFYLCMIYLCMVCTGVVLLWIMVRSSAVRADNMNPF